MAASPQSYVLKKLSMLETVHPDNRPKSSLTPPKIAQNVAAANNI